MSKSGFHPLLILAGALLVTPLLAGDPDWVISVDVPSLLGGTDRLPSEFVQTDGAVYSLLDALPPRAEIGAVGLRPDGSYLFTPRAPVDLGGTTYEGRDVVFWDGIGFSATLDGSAVGIPAESRIDSLQEEPDGSLLLSFRIPTTIGAVTFSRSDIARYDAATGFSLFFDSSTVGVPLYANVTGAGVDNAGDLVLTFDVPTELDGTNYLPGELVRWDGVSFDVYASDSSWPRSAQARGVGFFPPAGSIPDGEVVPGPQLLLTQNLGEDLDLTWGVSCLSSDVDYGVYEGTLGNFTSHIPKTCTTGGATSTAITPDSGSNYYLVVPRNAWREGSHGARSGEIDRPRGPSSCVPQLVVPVCP